VKPKLTDKENLDRILNYRFDNLQDYTDRIKPITDSLFNRIEEMQKALIEIAMFNVAENYGYLTERNEATSFVTCRNIARLALKGGESNDNT
jgi:hypothetical protein